MAGGSLSLASLCSSRTEGTLPQVFILGRVCVGGVCLLFSVLKFITQKTLANQELGHTPWPLASLSQGDLFENTLRPDASD